LDISVKRIVAAGRRRGCRLDMIVVGSCFRHFSPGWGEHQSGYDSVLETTLDRPNAAGGSLSNSANPKSASCSTSTVGLTLIVETLPHRPALPAATTPIKKRSSR
jgi:hypothetical protein